jgi:hypothetical protein
VTRLLSVMAALILVAVASLPVRSWGDVPEASPPERVDGGEESSDDSYDYDAEAREEARQEAAREAAERRAAAREEAARRDAERREAARQEAARREAARQEAARQDAARREAVRQEAARQDAARRQEAERRRQETESRRTGFGPYIRTVHVPLPEPSTMSFSRDAEISSRRSPIITLSPGTYAVLGSIGKTLKDVPQKIGEAVMTYAGGRAGVSNSDEYLAVLNVNKGLADDAVSQMQTAVRLIGRGYPEPETSNFLNSSSSRGLRVLVSSLSDVPEHAIVIAPADEEELEREGRSFWGWMTGAPR